MESLIVVLVCIIFIYLIKYLFGIKIDDVKKIKELGYDKELTEITNKLPDNKIDINKYKLLLENVKQEVLNTQYKAIYAVNKELMFMYWHIGKIILENTQWGNKFIDNLSMDLKMEFPEVKGFSIRNLKYMRKFAEEYPDFKFVQEVLAQIT